MQHFSKIVNTLIDILKDGKTISIKADTLVNKTDFLGNKKQVLKIKN